MKALALGFTLAVLGTAAFAAKTPTAAPNTLTAAEKAAGWTLLFDGKSLANFKGFKTPALDAGWHIDAEGGMEPDPKTSKDAVTKAKYENFDLTFDWKISKKGNSGVIFHVIDVGDETYESGPEYQLLDNSRGEPPLQRAGSLFALVAPSKDVTAPVGQWNHSRLLVDHGKVQHWMNGVLVTEYEIGSPDFKARVDHSKFRQWPQFATGKTGYIALQNHGDPVWFRNLKIKVIK
jgi:Domain of Unknown Function (DUF1080)